MVFPFGFTLNESRTRLSQRNKLFEWRQKYQDVSGFAEKEGLNCALLRIDHEYAFFHTYIAN